MRWLIRQLIRAYRLALSPLLGRHCRFHPSCSAYALEAYERFDLLTATRLTVARLAKCHPWHPGGYDPPPNTGGSDPTGAPRGRPHGPGGAAR